MRANLGFLGLFGAGALAALVGCTQQNPAYCQVDADCTDARFPRCDKTISSCAGIPEDEAEDTIYPVAVYVGGEGCADSGAGSLTRPYCKIQDALNDARARDGAVSIAAGAYAEDLVLDQDAILIGHPGTRLETQSCPGIEIYDGARVVLRGFELAGKGGIRVSDRASAEIRRLDVTVTSCIGVDCHEASCTLTRNRIRSNQKGGIALAAAQFTVVNNLIANNGDQGAFGGVRIGAPQGGSLFESNTVVDNESPENVPGGVICESSFEIRNNILWRNGSEEKPRDVSGACSVRFCDVSQGPAAVNGTNNFLVDPLFFNEESGDYHLRPESPCVDRGDALGAPNEDIDGNIRPKGAGVDIGAHEAA